MDDLHKEGKFDRVCAFTSHIVLLLIARPSSEFLITRGKHALETST